MLYSLSSKPSCAPTVLLTQLAAAEARCQQLERQLELMRRTVRLAQQDRTSLLQQQVRGHAAALLACSM